MPDGRWIHTLCRRERGAVVLAATAALGARLLFLGVPLSSDEAGFLLVGGQWHRGASLYGDYWVDRPPGLVALFAMADAGGGRIALRVIGALCAAASVLAAGWLARTVAAGRRPAAHASVALVAALVAALVSSPLLDVTIVNGEILALPFVLVGLTTLLLSVRPIIGAGSTSMRAHGTGRPATAHLWATLAGASGAAAIMIKQNFAEVAVAALVVVAVTGARAGFRTAAALVASLSIGAVLVVAPLLAVCVARGTALPDLVYAVVSFRSAAEVVIANSATEATPERAARLVGAVLATGVLLALPLLRRLPWRRSSIRAPGSRDPALTWLTVTVMVTEAASIAAGGSYWLHYLVQLVPGIALLASAAGVVDGQPASSGPTTPWNATTRLLVVVTASTVVALAVEIAHPREPTTDEVAVVDYLRDHAGRGSTVVVAYGNAGLVYESGMTSPYPDLWSLPVRVRDPELYRLSAVLDGSDRPQWLVMHGTSLTTWGVDGTAGDLAVAQHYDLAFTTDDYRVLEARSR